MHTFDLLFPMLCSARSHAKQSHKQDMFAAGRFSVWVHGSAQSAQVWLDSL